MHTAVPADFEDFSRIGGFLVGYLYMLGLGFSFLEAVIVCGTHFSLICKNLQNSDMA
jgi:hypothetical protein